MRRLVLHIGPPKTATSFLQETFRLNRAELRRDGIVYPRLFGRAGRAAHHGLPVALGRTIRGGWDDPHGLSLAQRLALLKRSSAEVVVLSSEYLWRLSEDRVEHLAELVGAEEVDVVVYLRRWSDVVYSRWSQAVKQRPVQPLAEYVVASKGRPMFAYAERLAVWADRFGTDALALIQLDNLDDSDPFSFLMEQVVGATAPSKRPDRAVNASSTYVMSELKRVLQRHRIDSGNAIEGLELTRRLDNAARVGHPGVGAAISTFRRVGPSRQPGLSRVDEAFQSDGEKVLASFGHRILNPCAGTSLFSPLERDVSIDRVASTDPEGSRCLEALFNELVSDDR